MHGFAETELCFGVHKVLEVRRPPRDYALRIADLVVCSGVIGTGLFLSSANSLRDGGPIGLLLGYIVIGTICYSVMVSGNCSLVRIPLNIVPRCRLGKWSPTFPSLAGTSN
jgi:hypothetical protein